MKAIDILNHFLSAGAEWVNRDKTVDGVIAGDPDKDVRTALVTWMPSFAALREAARRKVDLLLVHEPTFYGHMGELENVDQFAIARAKQRFVLENGFTLIRNHDVWDRFPEVGIPWAWGRFLGFGDSPVAFGAKRYQHRYDIAPVRVDELARKIAERCAAIGEPRVQVVGDGEKLVSKVGAGTGCACGLQAYRDIGCDVAIVCDDGSIYWRDIQRAEDEGLPVIRVNHGTSEEPGMVSMTEYVNKTFQDVKAEHLPHGCCFRLVGAE